jgi:hypothetical protein
MTQELNEFGRAIVRVDGTAQVSLQPDGVTRWHITRMVVKTDQGQSQTPIPRCTVYTNFVGDGQEIDGTYSGNYDSSDCGIWREPSAPIIARWTGGVPGTVAVFSIYGERVMA